MIEQLKNILLTQLPILILTITVGVLSALGDGVTDQLSFDRDRINSGQWYRLITCHLVHLGPTHAALNMVAAIVGWIIFRRVFDQFQWLICILVSALSISTMLWLSGVEWYVGFSAIIHSLMLLSIGLDRSINKITRFILIAGLVSKVLYEQFCGAIFSGTTVINGDVSVESHLFGLISSLILLLFFKFKDRIFHQV
ncbi:rhombosortase [Oceanicoccus sp. KOV_DT_Chl]|uniref:rhombosortase n=1 Tax=Oceanicoccus sp. KOV_DT_Chl TaxID=1904639 RepID=UPI000C7B3C88|nr:rhombosortase [Oceanicoccus sp. KOV_DT_Chl]